jgi:holo-[acyl-carrier-protein] synthase
MKKKDFRLGVDILNKTRVENVLLRFGERFLEKIAQSEEMEEIKRHPVHLKGELIARLFCAKEALYKMCGFGGADRLWIRAMPLKLERNNWRPDLERLRALAPGLHRVFLDTAAEYNLIVCVAAGEFFA